MASSGQIFQCPECGEIIGSHGVAPCAACGRVFHLDCLDPDSQFCLNCDFAIAASSKDPDQSGSLPLLDEAE